jgi:hypothetical protein
MDGIQGAMLLTEEVKILKHILKRNEIVLHVLYSKNTLKPLSNEGSHDVTSTEAKGEQDCHLQG